VRQFKVCAGGVTCNGGVKVYNTGWSGPNPKSPLLRIAVEEAGALLHLRCVVRVSKAADMTDTTLATELLLLDRCVESMREMAPNARNLQARIFAHLDDHPVAAQVCETVLTMVRHFLEDTGVRLLPVEVGSGPPRELRFRPSMGWVQTR
jgi:chemotaxis receptor (MCP) glutamine deamidase CheD